MSSDSNRGHGRISADTAAFTVFGVVFWMCTAAVAGAIAGLFVGVPFGIGVAAAVTAADIMLLLGLRGAIR